MAKITESRGRELLAIVCEQIGGQSELARMMTAAGAPVTQSAVSQWVRGESRPEPVLRAVLDQLVAIDEGDWTTVEEALVIATVMARTAHTPAPDAAAATPDATEAA